ncbi:MAG: ABC transporter permease [Acidobacteria bacterium]|nr:ABC transporter permease [Acidobacteriota bacterium]MBV9147036.1 ABC transporter permease [Acidobacteriota bacterium]
MQTVTQDIRYALRQLRQSPGFTITALITLAIGIGANTAIFTLVHGVLLKNLPVANPAQLYKLGDEYNCCVEGDLQNNWSMFAYPFYQYARDHTPSFEQLAAAQTNRPDLSVRRLDSTTPAQALSGEFVSGNYFSTLGVNAYSGRTLSAEDDKAGSAPVAVISYRTWQQKFGLDRSIMGAPVVMSGHPVTIVGIAPPAFFGDRLESDPPDFWLPLALEPDFSRENSLLHQTSAGWLYLIGRLRADAVPSQVAAQLTTELRQYLLTPGNASTHQDLKQIDKQVIHLAPGGAGINSMKDSYEQGLILLLAASAAILIIACANLANLLLARGTATRARTSLQLAIGATRTRIIRAQLTESLVLSVLGAALGLVVALYASKGMLLIAFRGSPNVPISTSPSLPVLLFTCAVAAATGIIFGVGPAWIASRLDPAEALRGVGRVTRDASALPQRSLIVLQAAVSLVLLSVAALLTESLKNLSSQSYGFERQGRLIVQISPDSAGYTQERVIGLYQQLEERFRHTPGVVNESLALYTAQQGNNWGEDIFFAGKTGDFGSSWDRVSANYFETIGTPIVRGRGISEQDTATSQNVAVVNEAFARKFFPNEDPIGKHFGKDERSHAGDYEIVGVAKDAKYGNPSRPARPMFFVALPQKIHYETQEDNRIEEASMYMGTIALHVNGDADSFAPTVRRVLAEIDPNLTPTSMRSFEELVSIQSSENTLIARLSNAFGLIALLLASVGLYGVTAYRVARRTSEVGLRMALGANRSNIVGLMLRGAFAQVGIGLLLGIPLCFLAKHWLAHQLFGIGKFDPLSLAFALGALGVCALIASILPAGRAAAIEPMQALRTE